VKLRKKGTTVLFSNLDNNLRFSDVAGPVFDEEETELLKIVESYCVSEKTKPAAVRSKFEYSPT
jgi:hypothetical protein